METALIGQQIQKFRKAAGMTQKELGTALGVSAQAVSQWEGGGTPDVTLLPALADRLGVTVDALFGREGTEKLNMAELLPKYVASLPEEKRLSGIYDLMWEVFLQDVQPLADLNPFRWEHCLTFLSDQGLMLGVNTEDICFLSVFPEPERGYAASFLAPDAYRALFALLARPGAMELLRCLHERPPRYCTAAVLAAHLGAEEKETEALLEAFAEQRLAERLELETAGGDVRAYQVNRSYALPVFLFAAKLLTGEAAGFHFECARRKAPLLRDRQGKGE